MNLVALTEEQFKTINQKLDFLINQTGKEQFEDKKWINSIEAKNLLGISNTTLWHYRNKGLIKGRRIGRKLYFSAQEVKELIENS